MKPDESPDGRNTSRSNEMVNNNGQDDCQSAPEAVNRRNEVEYLGGFVYVYVDAPEETPEDVNPTAQR